MSKIFVIGVLIVASLGTGFFAGYFVLRDQGADQSLSAGSVSRSKVTGPNNANVSSNSPSLKTRLFGQDTTESSLSFDEIDNKFSVFEKLKYTHDLADASTIEALETYILKTSVKRDPLFSYNLTSVFLEKYTSLDPLAAIDFVTRHPQLSNEQFITHVVTSWVRTDPEGAIDYFKSVENFRLKNTLAARLLGDPTLEANGFTDEILEAIGSEGTMMAGVLSTNQMPPPMALEEALKLGPRARMSAVQTALIRWLRDDPQATIARIEQHQNLEQRTQMFQAILYEYVNIDEDAAFAYANQYLTGNVQIEQQTLAMLGQQNPQRTLPLVENFIARTGNANPLNGIISTWIQKEPSAALAYIDTLDVGQRKTMIQSAAYSYVNSHPVEGFEWLLSKQDEYPQIVRGTIGNSINYNTVDMAQRIVGRITDEQTKTSLLVGIGNYKASQDPDSALSWLEDYRSEAGYSAAVQNIIASMAHQNPRAAADALTERLDDKSAAPIAGQIAANWYRADPSDAMRWVDNMDNGDAKSNALSNIAMMAAQQDPDEAIDIIQRLPQGRYREDAKRNVGFGLVGASPENVENIISDLELGERDAAQLRAYAERQAKMSDRFGS